MKIITSDEKKQIVGSLEKKSLRQICRISHSYHFYAHKIIAFDNVGKWLWISLVSIENTSRRISSSIVGIHSPEPIIVGISPMLIGVHLWRLQSQKNSCGLVIKTCCWGHYSEAKTLTIGWAHQPVFTMHNGVLAAGSQYHAGLEFQRKASSHVCTVHCPWSTWKHCL